MERDKNIGPYLAERIAFFKHFTYKTRVSRDIPDALSDGRVIVSGLEFIIQTVNREFEINVSPVKDEYLNKFKKHIERIKGKDFWRMESYTSQLKLSIDQLRSGLTQNEIDALPETRKNKLSFVDNRTEEVVKNSLRIKGTFLSYNKEDCHRYILDTIVKPLILYENFV